MQLNGPILYMSGVPRRELADMLGFGGTIDDDGTRRSFAKTDFRLRA